MNPCVHFSIRDNVIFNILIFIVISLTQLQFYRAFFFSSETRERKQIKTFIRYTLCATRNNQVLAFRQCDRGQKSLIYVSKRYPKQR